MEGYFLNKTNGGQRCYELPKDLTACGGVPLLALDGWAWVLISLIGPMKPNNKISHAGLKSETTRKL